MEVPVLLNFSHPSKRIIEKLIDFIDLQTGRMDQTFVLVDDDLDDMEDVESIVAENDKENQIDGFVDKASVTE